VSVQDRCTVCAKRTIGLGIVLDTHLKVLLGDEDLLEACFGLFEVGAILDTR
jgi:hypothetical protein